MANNSQTKHKFLRKVIIIVKFWKWLLPLFPIRINGAELDEFKKSRIVDGFFSEPPINEGFVYV